MQDARYTKLAKVLVNHSMRIQRGDKALVEATDIPPEMVAALVTEISAAGGLPFTLLRCQRVSRSLYKNATAEQMRLMGEMELGLMKQMDAYVGLRGSHNATELSDVPADKMQLYREHVWSPVHSNERVPNTKWVVLRWPTGSMAQQAGMSTEAFEDFYFDVCIGVDYAKLRDAQKPLQARMEAADKVHLLGPNDTDLHFSIKGIPVIPCYGERNIPDGECFTAPVRDSVNGIIHFNAPTVYQDKPFDDVRLVFKDGKIVEATSSNTAALNEVLDADEGARYVGEFSIAFNPYIRQPMRDILFDEKIAGSIHFTPGQAYEIADNGNRSQIHWDMVLMQRAEVGGGEIRFDGETIRKDGLFVPQDLQGLNPENLKRA
jgi:aminopeptidase